MALTPGARVGVIGLGKMGMPLAVNLLERGFVVTGYRRSGSSDLLAAGGQVATSPAEVAAASDVLVSIVPDAEAVEEVVLGPEGTLVGLRPGTVHIEMSTIDVERKARVRDAVVAAGGELLDCPVSGTPMMVGPRLATTFASGDQAALETVRPVLEALSGPVVVTGGFGTGARMKYIANMLVAVHVAAAAEAMDLAERCGLDLEVVQGALDSSIASSALWRTRGPVMRSRTWSPAPGPIDTLRPILEQIAATAEQVGSVPPLFTAARSVFDEAASRGWGALDVSSVFDLAAGRDALTQHHSPVTPQEAERTS